MTRSKNGGFSLIELMIVVAVVTILALIVMPKLSATIRKGNEAGTRGHLGAVRGALRVYFLDNEEVFPDDISIIVSPGSSYYNGPMPVLFTVEHGKQQSITQVPASDPLSDAGNWGYVQAGPERGFFWARCTHTDLSGKVWSQVLTGGTTMNPADRERQIKLVVMVNKYATPLAILLVGLGLVFTQPRGLVKAVSAGLLVFGVVFNLLAVPAIRRFGGECPWLPRFRMLVNIGANVVLVYFLGSYWTSIWMLLALTPIATAIYGSRMNTLLSSGGVSASLIGIQFLRGSSTPVEWGELMGRVAFIVLVSLLINELKGLKD